MLLNVCLLDLSTDVLYHSSPVLRNLQTRRENHDGWFMITRTSAGTQVRVRRDAPHDDVLRGGVGAGSRMPWGRQGNDDGARVGGAGLAGVEHRTGGERADDEDVGVVRVGGGPCAKFAQRPVDGVGVLALVDDRRTAATAGRPGFAMTVRPACYAAGGSSAINSRISA